MKPYVIHLPNNSDRNDNVLELCKVFNNTSVFHGIVPIWDHNAYSRAVRGCSLSHLSIIEANMGDQIPLLIMEDDAKFRPHVLQDVMAAPIPNDCGAIIMGGDVIDKFVESDDFYLEIIPPYYGTQAVWYNMGNISKSNFLTYAYKIMASQQIGNSGDTVGLCYESILLTAMQYCGLKIYRPKNMLFTTIESFSERDQTIATPKSEYLDV